VHQHRDISAMHWLAGCSAALGSIHASSTSPINKRRVTPERCAWWGVQFPGVCFHATRKQASRQAGRLAV